MTKTEQPDYKIVVSKGNIEIRDYPSMIFAEVEVMGERKQAINEGFKMLADYIFGNNTKMMGMTVSQQMSEKIAMTAPVIQQKDGDKWKVRFILPKKYSLETLPKPNSENIRLIPSPPKKFAVIRFSGVANRENIKHHTEELMRYLTDEKLESMGEVILAFYNPPWTLPFLRRNEVMIEIGMQE